MKKLTEVKNQSKAGPRRLVLEQANGRLQLLLERQKNKAISRSCGEPKQRLRRFRHIAMLTTHQQDLAEGCQRRYSEAPDCIRQIQALFTSVGLHQSARSQFCLSQEVC